MKLYFDVCSLCRPYDDLSQDRVYAESEAVLALIKKAVLSDWTIAASDMINIELGELNDPVKLENIMELYANANDFLSITDAVKERSRDYQAHRIKTYDSLHLALAELNGYDFLLTTDDRFFRAARQISLHTIVQNPLVLYMEVLNGE